MRIGLRGPFGQSTINLDESATVGQLQEKITEVSSLSVYDLKAGFPPKTLDLAQFDPTTKLCDTGLKLNGERIQVDPAKSDQPSSTASIPTPSSSTAPSHTVQSASQNSTQKSISQEKPLALTKKANKVETDPPAVLLSDGSYLVHRVMPDDNSCLFRAMGKCLMGSDLDAMVELRSAVAQGIQSDKERYNEVVLEKDPDAYCKWIQNPNSWGGAVEIQLIAEAFGVEVCALNLEDCSIQRFNEGKPSRIYLVYSGIHWDALASNPMGKWGEAEFDVTQFDAYDVEVEQKALEIGKILSTAGYYTNTSSFGIKCNTCGWTGKGEKSAVKHAEETGHADFGEAD